MIGAGRLTAQKGCDLLVRAFALVTAEHPNWVLEIYGGGPDEQALAAQIDRAGLASVVAWPDPPTGWAR